MIYYIYKAIMCLLVIACLYVCEKNKIEIRLKCVD